MDIDRSNFWQNLPTLLKTISESQYAAVDIEMSGVQVHSFDHRPVRTVQDAYEVARQAAEKFTILQLGLTCVSWAEDQKAYITKSYNIPIYPGVVVDDINSSRLSGFIKRCFSMNTSSVDFLQNEGFDFASVFHKGVPYMSLQEYTSHEINIAFREGIFNRPSDEDCFDEDELPEKASRFRQHVEDKLLDDWGTPQPPGFKPKPVRIHSPSGRRLNTLQKRIVHQLLLEDFGDLVAVSRDGGCSLEVAARQRESSLSYRTTKRFEAICKQSGARILWDAICGQRFADSIEPQVIVGDDASKCQQLMTDLALYEGRLQTNSPVFVGHNVMMDLCFLHRTFVGELPESVHDFRAAINKRLPRIVDTKYLFTRGGDEMSPDYSLVECFATMRDQKIPAVLSDPTHGYSQCLPHQAGYDSKSGTNRLHYP
jgi:poly(A)-specific ribonuclease